MFDRALSEGNFKRFKADFQFLFERIREERGELELFLRGNYFNLYYRGNSLAKVEFGLGNYLVKIHEKFARGVFEPVRFGEPKPSADYLPYSLPEKLLHPFFSKAHIQKLESRIKNLNFSDEIAFEQMLINDNRGREDFLLIDRQITGGKIEGKMDLLALRQAAPNSRQFQFVALEVKLGNSPELRGEVGDQLDRYVRALEKDFKDFKESYEHVYVQLKDKDVGLITTPTLPSLEIVPGVLGCVIVGGYRGLAEEKLKYLRKEWPDLPLLQMRQWIKIEA
jgi:hypothetical protein